MRTHPLTLAASLLLASGLTALAEAQTAAARTQQAKTFEQKITITAKLNYLLSLPTDYGSSWKSWPLVLFLHGAGETATYDDPEFYHWLLAQKRTRR